MTKRGIASRKRRMAALGMTLLSFASIGLFSIAFASWNFEGGGAGGPAFVSGIEADVGTVVDFDDPSYFRLTASSISDFSTEYGFVQPDGSFGNSGSIAALFYVNGSSIGNRLGGNSFAIQVTGGFGSSSFALSGSYDYAFGDSSVSDVDAAEPYRADGPTKAVGSDGRLTTDWLSSTDMGAVSWLCVWFDFSVSDGFSWNTLNSQVQAAGFNLSVLFEARA